MQKKTWAKLGGFAVALACTGTLVGFAASGTGAYFTASSSGSINGSTGTVNLSTATTNLNFNGLLPGQYQTQSFTYNVSGGTGDEDVYLEFKNVNAFQEVPTPGATPLGRYGHLAVSGPAGTFSSFNLATDPGTLQNPPNPDPTDCQVDAFGRGGNQTTEATSTSDFHDGFCPAPQFILLSYDMKSSDPTATASITFGFTGLLTSPENTAIPQIPFTVVAVQHGVAPGDPRNGGV
jgi:hypothetical protein